MAEGHVTVEGVTHRCPRPSSSSPRRTPSNTTGRTRCPNRSSTASCSGCASATPSFEAEKEVLRDREHGDPLDELRPVMTAADIAELQRSVADRLGGRRARGLPDAGRRGDARLGDARPRRQSRAARSRSSAPRSRSPSRRSATTACPTTSSGSSSPSSRTASSSTRASRLFLRRSEEAEAALREIMKTVSVPI